MEIIKQNSKVMVLRLRDRSVWTLFYTSGMLRNFRSKLKIKGTHTHTHKKRQTRDLEA